MKKRIALAFCFSMLAPIVMCAQSPFDGTWKVNLKSAQMPTKPDVFLIQGGMYHCKTCVPPIDVKADGQDHEVTGHPYYDSIAVKIVDGRTLEETDKKGGKVVATSKVTVSADGKTATFEFSDSSNSNGAPVTGKGEDVLVAKGPAGSHAASGSWRTVKLSTLSDNGLTFTYKVDGNTLNMSAPTGQSYAAKLDGTEAPYNGDPGTSSVTVKSIGKSVIEETDKRGGKVISVQRSTVSADGKMMSIAVTDTLRGTTMHFTASKQ